MSTFGKVLAFLNVVAAIAFVFLAAQARGTRHAWAYAAFRHELVLDGLPLDESEKDLDGTPRYQKITDATASQLFSGAPAKTLERELDRRKEELEREIDAPETKDKRARLEQILLPTARTGGEREQIRKATPEQLKAIFDGTFADAKAAKREMDREERDADSRRQAIAHVLVGTAEEPGNREKTEANLRRAFTALGVRHYTRAIDAQGVNLRALGEKVRLDIISEREAFVRAQEGRARQVLELADHNEDLKRVLQQLRDQKTDNHESLVAARKQDVANYTKELTSVETARDAALARQKSLEKELFTVQRKLGEASDRNQRLERDIRLLEVGR